MTNKNEPIQETEDVVTDELVVEESLVEESLVEESIEDENTFEQTEVERLQAQLDEKENEYLRLRADFDNYRRRVQKDSEAAAKYRSQSLVNDLLPVVDNFERALETSATTEEAKTLLKGVEMVFRMFKQALESEGVLEINPDGEPFDPNFHQAVIQEASDTHESGTVIQTLQKGYQLKDRIIRPAMVKVSE
ncbi:nucleotide exchange factor GrpE [Chryseomicrobium palamuruense]|uniref:Protein GrpE n=1 Tax=Chryseomicrobium palamuruense TaxID=682973 RepID=A0ABV8UXP3_9BACL